MDYGKFQLAVVEIAHNGSPLTVANVVARLRIDPDNAERMLDRMARDGRLDLEVDETEGVVVFRVRGLTPRTVNDRLEELRKDVGGVALQHVGTALSFGKPFSKRSSLPLALQRSVPLGALLGALLPGVGLAYSAPWPIVALATLGAIIAFKVAGFLWFLGLPIIVLTIAASGAAGALYTWRFNQEGKRSALLPPDPSRRLPR